eukprot:1343811-Rhodomonas_salina.1
MDSLFVLVFPFGTPCLTDHESFTTELMGSRVCVSSGNVASDALDCALQLNHCFEALPVRPLAGSVLHAPALDASGNQNPFPFLDSVSRIQQVFSGQVVAATQL